MKTIETTWEVWTYDVWGNAEDGYEVNDRHCDNRALTLRLKVERNNPDTPQEFLSAYPTDRQLAHIFGAARRYGGFDTDGDDLTIYVTARKDGYPVGELHCTSHASLSPIRSLAEVK